MRGMKRATPRVVKPKANDASSEVRSLAVIRNRTGKSVVAVDRAATDVWFTETESVLNDRDAGAVNFFVAPDSPFGMVTFGCDG